MVKPFQSENFLCLLLEVVEKWCPAILRRKMWELKRVDTMDTHLPWEMLSRVSHTTRGSCARKMSLLLWSYHDVCLCTCISAYFSKQVFLYSKAGIQYISANNPLARKKANSTASLHEQHRAYFMPTYATPLFIQTSESTFDEIELPSPSPTVCHSWTLGTGLRLFQELFLFLSSSSLTWKKLIKVQFLFLMCSCQCDFREELITSEF